jgi:hypothetical protein
MPLPGPKRARKSCLITMAIGVAALLIVVWIVVYLLKLNPFNNSPVSAQPNSHGNEDLPATLARLETDLPKRLTPEQMQDFAEQIEARVKEHPLPNDDDDLHFCSELVVKYLRELARIEAYRRGTMKKSGYDPLDPKSSHPNLQAIELHEKYSKSLVARARQLRQGVSR